MCMPSWVVIGRYWLPHSREGSWYAAGCGMQWRNAQDIRCFQTREYDLCNRDLGELACAGSGSILLRDVWWWNDEVEAQTPCRRRADYRAASTLSSNAHVKSLDPNGISSVAILAH